MIQVLVVTKKTLKLVMKHSWPAAAEESIWGRCQLIQIGNELQNKTFLDPHFDPTDFVDFAVFENIVALAAQIWLIGIDMYSVVHCQCTLYIVHNSSL